MAIREETARAQESRLTSLTLAAYSALIFVWTLAWIAKVDLDTHLAWLATSAGGFAYWTVAKLLIWTLPAFWLIRLSGRSVQDVLNLKNRGWLLWGGPIGLAIASTEFIPK